MRYRRLVVPLVGLSLVAGSAGAQQIDRAFRNQWFWGAQASLLYYQTNAQPYYFDPGIGGHWLITAERTGLLISYEQYFLLVDARSCILAQGQSSPYCGTDAREVRFNQVRRFTAGLLAFPSQGHLMPYAGAGFAITQVLDPFFPASELFASPDEFNQASATANEAATRAFGVFILGGQIRVGKFHLFGQYTITSNAGDFLLRGATHDFTGGMRYSLGSSREDVTRRH